MLHSRGAMLIGLGLGAGLMFFADPDRGRRRRALMRDRAVHWARMTGDAMGATRRDLAHRASGVAARTRALLRRDASDDAVLVERVRTELGRVVSHPRAIDVEAIDGRVTLRGPILRSETERLVSAVGRVRGVEEVVSALEEHDTPGDVPALQGEGSVARSRAWQRWSPTARILVGTAGSALAGYGLSRARASRA